MRSAIVLGRHQGLTTVSHGGSWCRLPAAQRSGSRKSVFAARVLAKHQQHGHQGPGLEDHRSLSDIRSRVLSSRPTPPPPPRVKRTSRRLGTFPGHYRLGPGWLLTITREGDRLWPRQLTKDKVSL